MTEEKAKNEDLYERFRSAFNKLTPHKFDSLHNHLRSLQIDTQEKMEGVVNLVFEMAISEPESCLACALGCKEFIALLRIPGINTDGVSAASNFRKLIITRCQSEFEKDPKNEELRLTKAKEIEECTDQVEKQKLQMLLEDEKQKMRNRSVCNIRFIGELFNQGMLTKKIMHFCINHLLQNRNEENLERLCKLLTTIGKNLEIHGDLKEYFRLIHDIINNEGPDKLSSRVSKMLQEVIDLRENKWEPKKVDSNPMSSDNIQRENEIASSKESACGHKYSEMRKMRKMQLFETSNLCNEPFPMDVNNSEPRPKSPQNLKRTFSINQSQQKKERNFSKQPRPKSKKKPNRQKQNFKCMYDKLDTEDRTILEALYKEILRLPNTSAPPKLETLIQQGRSLQYESQERLLRIVELILEKATKETSFSFGCAFISKEFELFEVTDPSLTDTNANNFGRIIVTRCKIEFEKDSQIDEFNRNKAKEIEGCTDPEKKLKLQMLFEAEENEKRLKSLANIKFIGELFKQRMLTKSIMHGYIKHLLLHKGKLNLERLCKLLTVIGKNLERKEELKDYFEEMQEIINDKSPGEISSEVLNVIKDVIQLRANKWISRNNDNSKTRDEIDDFQLGNKFTNMTNKTVSIESLKNATPNKLACLENISSDQVKRELLLFSELKSKEHQECEISENKSCNEDRCSQIRNQELNSSSSNIECSVLNGTKSTSVSNFKKSDAELMYVLNAMVEEYIAEANNEDVLIEIEENFSRTKLPMLVREMINAVMKKSMKAREKISKLLSFLLSEKVITLKDFKEGFGQILEMFDVLVIEIPQIRTYLAEILVYLLIEETHPISELKTTLESLRNKGESGKLVAKLFSKISEVSGSKSIGEKWRQSGLQLSDIINPEQEKIDQIVRNYKLEFLIRDCENLKNEASTSETSTDDIQSYQKYDKRKLINRSKKSYSFKTSKFKNKSLFDNGESSKIRSRNSECLKSCSSSNQNEQIKKKYSFNQLGWKLHLHSRQKQGKSSYDNLNTEEEKKLDTLYKEIFRDTDIKSRKFDSFIDFEKSLKSESPERLIEIINFIFQKANEEPSFSIVCALMCKELFHMKISNPKHKITDSVRSLIINRSYVEFRKYSVEEVTKIGKLQMQIKIELSRLRNLQLQLEEEEKKMEKKSVSNVKFLGELFKQGILTSKHLKELQESKEME